MDINRLTNLRQAYEELERRVQRALNTQVGDSERLAEAQSEVLSYSQAVEQVCRIHPTKISILINHEYSIPSSFQLKSSHVAGKTLCR
jgi:hypothetical protein